MSIRAKGPGTWEVRKTHGHRQDGRPRSMSRTVHGSYADAQAAETALAAQMGADPTLGRGTTLRTVWGAYRDSRGQRLAPKTLSVYAWHMERHWLPAIGDMDVTSVTRAVVQAELLGRGWSHDTAVRNRRILSTVLTWAANEGMLPSNPIRVGGFEYPQADEPDYDDDPFAAIERERDVWGAETVARAMPMMRGLALEPAWLMCVGAGLRVEEALAVRKVDVRRVGDVTQLAVHHATPAVGGRRATKTAKGVRVVGMANPMGRRLWEIADAVKEPLDPLCKVSASRQNKLWRLYFEQPPEGWHPRMADSRKAQGRLFGLPYIPLSRMRATHATLMQEAGVPDAVNSLYHGHSDEVAYAHYRRPELDSAAKRTSDYLDSLSASADGSKADAN